jgi:hypothetical protein
MPSIAWDSSGKPRFNHVKTEIGSISYSTKEKPFGIYLIRDENILTFIKKIEWEWWFKTPEYDK